METYELTYIISPQINSEQIDNLTKEIEDLIQGKEGLILKSEKTQAKMLAYPIKNQNSGYFRVVEFKMPENKLKEVKNQINKNDKVLRSLLSVKKITKETKKRRSRRPITIPGFEIKRKPSIIESILKKGPKKEEEVDAVDLDKKLDELLNE